MLLGILSPILNLCMLQKNLIKQESQKRCWGIMANEQKNPEDSLGCTLHKRGWGVAQIRHPRSTAPQDTAPQVQLPPAPGCGTGHILTYYCLWVWEWATRDVTTRGCSRTQTNRRSNVEFIFTCLQVLRSATIYLSGWYNFSNHRLFIYPYLLCSGYLPC